MRVLAVPLKRLDHAKRRLAPVLGERERAALALAMFEDVVDACLAQRGWEVLVVARDDDVLERIARRGARAVRERGSSLGAAIRQVESMLSPDDDLGVVLGDLPFVTADAVASALEAPAAVSAVPAHSDGGTNVLIRKPWPSIAARFGRASFAKHRSDAHDAGVSFETIESDALAFDLDRPGDLAQVATAPGGGRAWRLALALDLGRRVAAPV